MTTKATTTYAVNGFAIRELRKRAGISVADLAERVGVQRPYVAKIELGHSRRVSPAVFKGIVLALAIEDPRAILNDPHSGALIQVPA